MERLELRESLVRVPAVLCEAHVRELVVERGDLLQLENERLLLVGLQGQRQRRKDSRQYAVSKVTAF